VRGVAQQRKIELLFDFEACKRFLRISACAENLNTEFVEVLLGVTKLGRFDRSTGRVRFREEEQHGAPALQVLQREFAAIVHFQVKVWRFVPDF
jgi:hypothetical protein